MQCFTHTVFSWHCSEFIHWWQITLQWKYLNNKQVCETVMMAKPEQGMAATVGIKGEREWAATLIKWASKELQAAVSEGLVKGKAAVSALISYAHFNLPSFVHNSEFCFLQVRCPVVSESSGYHVRLTFRIQDTLSYRVLEKCATLLTTKTSTTK